MCTVNCTLQGGVMQRSIDGIGAAVEYLRVVSVELDEMYLFRDWIYRKTQPTAVTVRLHVVTHAYLDGFEWPSVPGWIRQSSYCHKARCRFRDLRVVPAGQARL